ncbi:hypothetical protein NEUTE2DRAFT_68860 [Neurospora tetrasperma FGSC 2509]|nr:hypothetical protein NEUTE2DRAFT_68860 [Neurospora tetrasperma FGSC 2509]
MKPECGIQIGKDGFPKRTNKVNRGLTHFQFVVQLPLLGKPTRHTTDTAVFPSSNEGFVLSRVSICSIIRKIDQKSVKFRRKAVHDWAWCGELDLSDALVAKFGIGIILFLRRALPHYVPGMEPKPSQPYRAAWPHFVFLGSFVSLEVRKLHLDTLWWFKLRSHSNLLPAVGSFCSAS